MPLLKTLPYCKAPFAIGLFCTFSLERKHNLALRAVGNVERIFAGQPVGDIAFRHDAVAADAGDPQCSDAANHTLASSLSF